MGHDNSRHWLTLPLGRPRNQITRVLKYFVTVWATLLRSNCTNGSGVTSICSKWYNLSQMPNSKYSMKHPLVAQCKYSLAAWKYHVSSFLTTAQKVIETYILDQFYLNLAPTRRWFRSNDTSHVFSELDIRTLTMSWSRHYTTIFRIVTKLIRDLAEAETCDTASSTVQYIVADTASTKPWYNTSMKYISITVSESKRAQRAQ